jgi:hypothetical protein
MGTIPALAQLLRDTRLNSATREVVNALEYARLNAMTTGKKTRAVIGAPDNRIALNQYVTIADLFNGGNVLPATVVETSSLQPVMHPLEKGEPYEIRFDDENRFNGVGISASDFDLADPVVFDSRGIPSKGGAVTVSQDERNLIVTLEAANGRVSVTE